MPNVITADTLQVALPAKMKKSINQALIDSINNTLANEETIEIFKENLLSYGDVMREGKFKIENYISAVKYVTFKLLGATNKDAYIKTFPDKYNKFKQDGVSDKDIASYSTAYNKSKLVNLIYEQTLVPTHVLNAPMFQKAINTQAYLMVNAKSEKVRSDAANSILTHLKRPEVAKVELDIALKESDTVGALRDATQALVDEQKKLIQNKEKTVKEIAGTVISSKPLED